MARRLAEAYNLEVSNFEAKGDRWYEFGPMAWGEWIQCKSMVILRDVPLYNSALLGGLAIQWSLFY